MLTNKSESNGNDAFSIELTDLPIQLKLVVKADSFMEERHRWNTNEVQF